MHTMFLGSRIWFGTIQRTEGTGRHLKSQQRQADLCEIKASLVGITGRLSPKKEKKMK